ncbi:hypothetical protein B5X24_HaOG208928 [Helicoverpa armigera]|uniref:Uncharacterized protein n=1 Tax=Helicoverpa armigera TaxID=29058 RepID=A0A2W1BJ83_HELAM|nr:hypothetical protein B5X24_HaOG208928 [Helicoverpa armigera]
MGCAEKTCSSPAPTHLEAVQSAVEEEWNGKPQEFIIKLIRSMKNRLRAVIELEGVTLNINKKNIALFRRTRRLAPPGDIRPQEAARSAHALHSH